MEIDYYSKYLKYKNKYLTLQKQIKGGLFDKTFSQCKEGSLKVNNEFPTSNSTYIKTTSKNGVVSYSINYTKEKRERGIQQFVNTSYSINNKNVKQYSFDKSCNFIKTDIEGLNSKPTDKSKSLN